MAESKLTKLGSSLPVPIVQELPREPLTKPSISFKAALHQVPVIDMQKLISGDTMDLGLDKFHQACKEWGFFQLINHGANKSLVEKMKTQLEGLFNLPMEEKKKLYMAGTRKYGGIRAGNVVSEDQKLDWAELFFLNMHPIHMRKPHLFSALPPCFGEAVEDYSAELRNLATRIFEQMATSLRLDFNEIKENYEQGWQSMRMKYYPPCPQPELVIGLNPHSDAGGLTILLQVNEMEGLQITKDGESIPVKTLPDAFVVNIGDSLEHRATVNSAKERLSIAAFYSPGLDGTIGPAPRLVTRENPARFKTMTSADYYKGYFACELRGKSYLEVIKIQQNEELKNK
ncbi:hypothetical protein P3X46_033060 [Hevea brasiliensis]|uniref:Fe2OG dioxygenase domain-containing protein n=1 Tax=Hevea brasiliensis TaxID=3981 RepID=A0ABQ9KFB3_HEVBR|nr:hypothetical protein P3X46_033060 [Hevea brasiliensis]